MGDKENSEFQKSKKNFPKETYLLILIIILTIILALNIYLFIPKIITFVSKPEGPKEKINKPAIQVEVLNGCGSKGLADTFTELLRKKNFDVVKIGNYTSFDVDNTFLIDRTGNTKNALDAADSLGISAERVIKQTNKNYFLDVTLVIGKDYKEILNQ